MLKYLPTNLPHFMAEKLKPDRLLPKEEYKATDRVALAGATRNVLEEILVDFDEKGDSEDKEYLSLIKRAHTASDETEKLESLIQAVEICPSSIFLLAPNLAALVGQVQKSDCRAQLQAIVNKPEFEETIAGEIGLLFGDDDFESFLEESNLLHEAGIIGDNLMGEIKTGVEEQKTRVLHQEPYELFLHQMEKAGKTKLANNVREFHQICKRDLDPNEIEAVMLELERAENTLIEMSKARQMLEDGSQPNPFYLVRCIDDILDEGRPEEALVLLRKWYELNPNSPKIIAMLAIILQKSGKCDELEKVLADIDHLSAGDPNEAEALEILQTMRKGSAN
jgi:hypothetical protein